MYLLKLQWMRIRRLSPRARICTVYLGMAPSVNGDSYVEQGPRIPQSAPSGTLEFTATGWYVEATSRSKTVEGIRLVILS